MHHETSDDNRVIRSRFLRHSKILMWKSYLQRQRRWRLLLGETVFASIMYTLAIWTAKPVFLTPLEAEPEAPLTTPDLLASLNRNNIVGYAPDKEPYISIMNRAAQLLGISILRAATEDDLNDILYSMNKGSPNPLDKPVIWVIWKPSEASMWNISIRSSERAKYQTKVDIDAIARRNPHLRCGFLAVQVAISQAIVEYSSVEPPKHRLNLRAMPVSPLMQEYQVKSAISNILQCFTISLIPPVIETQALVISETSNKFKRGLRIRSVSYTSMYMGWLLYAYLTALPICFVAAITLLMIFRWIHLVFALVILLGYITVMIMTALIMSMFHNKVWIACIWGTLYTILQTYLAELLVHHEYDMKHGALTFLMHILMPPLGLVHAFNQFALLQTGRYSERQSLFYSFGSWFMLIILYFAFLMLLQRTIGQERAIGGQVSWKSIIFKKIEDVNELHKIETPTGRERDKLQKVDEFVAKAVSFVNVSKSIMGVTILDKITLDVYRGEYTVVFAERVQEKMVICIEDLLTGLTFPDKGTINVLGHRLCPGKENFMNAPHMMGYCHHAMFLIQDLTVQEHFTLFNDIYMWSESREYISQYGLIRLKQLLKECDLEDVRYQMVRRLDVYYQAQLIWALATFMEPRIVIIPFFSDQHNTYARVITDKIMRFRKYMTLIKMEFSSLRLENADRVFIFDSKVLAFGGTPAYMFFKYGREYRLRMTIRNDADGNLDESTVDALLERSAAAGATVRAQLGSLLILRLPTSPTAPIVELVTDLMDNNKAYGITTLHISLPDSEEVCSRAMLESRATIYERTIAHQTSKDALKRMAEPLSWRRNSTSCINIFSHLRHIGWKYFSFHVHYRLYFLITVISALLLGIFMGLTLSRMLVEIDRDAGSKQTLIGEKLTMENLNKETILVLRSDDKMESISLVNAYVLSEPDATESALDHLSYTALAHTESLTEYLVTRAIDSPQFYVRMYAYGIDAKTTSNGTLMVSALYSPLHKDSGAAARSLAKVFTALLRLNTDTFNASIEVTDDPLFLDLTPTMKYIAGQPLVLQFLLILSISYFILLPSLEKGLVRHMQSHAMNFNPALYWFTLYICDLILYWMMVALMSCTMFVIMYLVAPPKYFRYEDLVVMPFMLILFGFSCVPQAYLFSLGPRVTLNAMTFVIVNIIFGDNTIVAKIFSGEGLSFMLLLTNISPLFNMAYGFVKINQIFLYNSECVIFQTRNLCSNKILHKCCQKCGVLQKCFSKRSYLTKTPGIMQEVTALCTTAGIFMSILLLIEYKVIQRTFKWIYLKYFTVELELRKPLKPGAKREKNDVLEKWDQLNVKRNQKLDTFGEYLLVKGLASKHLAVYTINNIYLGLGKGEAVALSGLKRHGRIKLIELLAGLSLPTQGHACTMARWNINSEPHKYARQISISCGQESLPQWMTVYDALALLAMLRGVPNTHIKEELNNIIEALEMGDQVETPIRRISQKADCTRLQFAAAIVGAPPIIILDECTAYQKFSVRRAMYCILHILKRRGHGIFVSSSSVETHMPITNRLAILLEGTIYDIDAIDNLVNRYSPAGYTVVLHLKDEVDVTAMFARYFKNFTINDTSEVLVNVQILDDDLNWAVVFEKMETLKTNNHQVYSYIITVVPIDYIYNSIINNEKANKISVQLASMFQPRSSTEARIKPTHETLLELIPFGQRYDIMKLKELPWSVIFHTQES